MHSFHTTATGNATLDTARPRVRGCRVRHALELAFPLLSLPADPTPSARSLKGGWDGGADLTARALLLAEDEALVSLDLTMALEEAGASVVPTYSLDATMNAARSGAFDAAVLDVNLAGVEVFPAARVLADQGVPLVFHTGHERPETIALEYPNALTLSKPIATDQVVQGVCRVLHAPACKH